MRAGQSPRLVPRATGATARALKVDVDLLLLMRKLARSDIVHGTLGPTSRESLHKVQRGSGTGVDCLNDHTVRDVRSSACMNNPDRGRHSAQATRSHG